MVNFAQYRGYSPEHWFYDTYYVFTENPADPLETGLVKFGSSDFITSSNTDGYGSQGVVYDDDLFYIKGTSGARYLSSINTSTGAITNRGTLYGGGASGNPIGTSGGTVTLDETNDRVIAWYAETRGFIGIPPTYNLITTRIATWDGSTFTTQYTNNSNAYFGNGWLHYDSATDTVYFGQYSYDFDTSTFSTTFTRQYAFPYGRDDYMYYDGNTVMYTNSDNTWTLSNVSETRFVQSGLVVGSDILLFDNQRDVFIYLHPDGTVTESGQADQNYSFPVPTKLIMTGGLDTFIAQDAEVTL